MSGFKLYGAAMTLFLAMSYALGWDMSVDLGDLGGGRSSFRSSGSFWGGK